jgi:hypothetical protein
LQVGFILRFTLGRDRSSAVGDLLLCTASSTGWSCRG